VALAQSGGPPILRRPHVPKSEFPASYLLNGASLFHQAHRAVDDCHANFGSFAELFPRETTSAPTSDPAVSAARKDIQSAQQRNAAALQENAAVLQQDTAMLQHSAPSIGCSSGATPAASTSITNASTRWWPTTRSGCGCRSAVAIFRHFARSPSVAMLRRRRPFLPLLEHFSFKGFRPSGPAYSAPAFEVATADRTF
jgi:hypothetical protein